MGLGKPKLCTKGCGLGLEDQVLGLVLCGLEGCGLGLEDQVLGLVLCGLALKIKSLALYSVALALKVVALALKIKSLALYFVALALKVVVLALKIKSLALDPLSLFTSLLYSIDKQVYGGITTTTNEQQLPDRQQGHVNIEDKSVNCEWNDNQTDQPRNQMFSNDTLQQESK